MYSNQPKRRGCALTNQESQWLIEVEVQRIEEQVDVINKTVIAPIDVITLCDEEELDSQLIMERLNALQK